MPYVLKINSLNKSNDAKSNYCIANKHQNNSKMKNFVIAFTAFCYLATFKSVAQIATSNGFNYYEINQNQFLVNASCTGLPLSKQKEQEYFYTNLLLAKQLESIFQNATDSINFISGGYIFHKRTYLNKLLGGQNFKWILIRPNDAVVRPCILLTHGGKTGGGDLTRTIPLGVTDYVQRGFAVVYYESGPASATNTAMFVDAGFTPSCVGTGSWTPDTDIECFQQALLIKAQFVQAALQFASHYSSLYHLDTANFFGVGFSGGSIGTLTNIFADNSNFQDPIFNGMGNSKNNLSRFPNETTKFKAVNMLAGGLLNESLTQSYKIGSLLNAPDTTTSILMFHGQDDFAVKPDIGPLFWIDPQEALPGSVCNGPLKLKPLFDSLNIKNKIIINCSSGHDIFSYTCDENDDLFGNSNTLANCTDWYTGLQINFDFVNVCNASNSTNKTELDYILKQIHDYTKIGAWFFHQNFSNSGATPTADTFIDNILNTNAVSTIAPASLPYDEANGNVDGTMQLSSKCLIQTCNALYFNREGDNVNPNLFKGDYLSTNQFNNSAVFNQNFTLELKFKTNNQQGEAILFSHLNNLTIGFELIITNSGYVQFKKNVGSSGSILGNTSVKDNHCHTVTLTRFGNVFSLYLDGVLQETNKTFAITFPSVANTTIGNTSDELNLNKGFNGLLRNIRIYNSAIPSSQFAQDNLPANTPNLVADWKFEEPVFQTANSTNGSYQLTMGKNSINRAYDPRWVSSDSICSCAADQAILSVKNTNANSSNFSVYPNPSSGSITISSIDVLNEKSTYSIFNVSGQLINTGTLAPHSTSILIQQNGVYILQIQQSGNSSFYKVIITH